MEYNTTRTRMLMPEYGRNVQKMVAHLMGIEDKEKRSQYAEGLVELMGILNPHLKTIEDYKHKLWDHLYQMTDFKLDVDSPYPPPSKEEIMRRPEPFGYPQESKKNRHFGKNLTSLIDKALQEKDPEKQQGFTQIIGYYMKLAYANWHREPVHDDMIKSELAELTNGVLVYEGSSYKVRIDNRSHKQNRNNRGRNNNNNRNRNNNNGNNRRRNRFKNKNK